MVVQNGLQAPESGTVASRVLRRLPVLVSALTFMALQVLQSRAFGDGPEVLLETYCFDCHDEDVKKGNFDMAAALAAGGFDGSLMFENLITGKMPPDSKPQPSADERRTILDWLAERETRTKLSGFRRITRHEFVHSVNDLLGTDLDLADEIPADRGTHDFDSDRRIKLGRELLSAYFSVADEMLESAFPAGGFAEERVWVTSQVKDSHETYRIYHRPYLDGILFSWTRANNGNSYSFFYDNFDPPVAGWYELTFDAMKVGDFREDVSSRCMPGNTTLPTTARSRSACLA